MLDGVAVDRRMPSGVASGHACLGRPVPIRHRGHARHAQGAPSNAHAVARLQRASLPTHEFFLTLERRGRAIQTTQLAAAPTWPRYAKGLDGSVQESAEQRGCHEADVDPEEAYRRLSPVRRPRRRSGQDHRRHRPDARRPRLLSVLAFHFPEYLTTPDLRQQVLRRTCCGNPARRAGDRRRACPAPTWCLRRRG